MEQRFENIWFSYNTKTGKCYVGIKDRETTDNERWVLALLTREEAEELYS